jgi:hypothetical protein
MKLKKLNEKQIALSNSSMQKIQGGQQYRFTYCTPYTEDDFNNHVPSSDRITEVWIPPDGSGCGGYWSIKGTFAYGDSPANPNNPK